MATLLGESVKGRGLVLGDNICKMYLAEHVSVLYNSRNQPVEVAWTPTEWRILELLLRNKDCLVSDEQIFRICWGEGYLESPSSKPVHQWHIANIRRKIKLITGRADKNCPLKVVRGFGYKWETPVGTGI